mmetsp:Transcript_14734/g.22012  ORF Transcript_14734/g.22012 Transcript_14734/m.22012 type:complete len:402 (-) Transcript_14734:233-1438(-)
MTISSTTSSHTRELSDPSEVMTYFLTGMSTVERKRHRARSIKFPLKLMYVLECGHYSEIIAWNPEGGSFTILKTNEFEERVLPEIFKEAKFSSFQRKLTRWSFVKKHYASSCYSHPSFKRGNWAICKAMQHDRNKQQPGIQFNSHKYHISTSLPQGCSLSSKKKNETKMQSKPMDEKVQGQVKSTLPLDQQTLPLTLNRQKLPLTLNQQQLPRPLKPLNVSITPSMIIDREDLISRQHHRLAQLYPGLASLMASERKKIEEPPLRTVVGQISSELSSPFRNYELDLQGMGPNCTRIRHNSNLQELLLSSYVASERNGRAIGNLCPSKLHVPAMDQYSILDDYATEHSYPLLMRPNSRTSLFPLLFSNEQNRQSTNNPIRQTRDSDLIIQRAYQVLLNRSRL